MEPVARDARGGVAAAARGCRCESKRVRRRQLGRRAHAACLHSQTLRCPWAVSFVCHVHLCCVVRVGGGSSHCFFATSTLGCLSRALVRQSSGRACIERACTLQRACACSSARASVGLRVSLFVRNGFNASSLRACGLHDCVACGLRSGVHGGLHDGRGTAAAVAASTSCSRL